MSCLYFLYRLLVPLHNSGHLRLMVYSSCLSGNPLQVSLLWEDNDEEGRTHPCSVSANCPYCLSHWTNIHSVVVWLFHSTLPKLGMSAKQRGCALLHYCSAWQHIRQCGCDYHTGYCLGDSQGTSVNYYKVGMH